MPPRSKSSTAGKAPGVKDNRSGRMSFSSRTGKNTVGDNTKQSSTSFIAAEITGKFTGNARGFGFVSPKAAGLDDIFIPPHGVGQALDGDIVTCVITKVADEENGTGHRTTGKIIAVTERNALVGAFFAQNAPREEQGIQGFIRPVETKIPHIFSVPPKTVRRLGLVDGHRVLFLVDKPAKGNSTRGNASYATANVTEIIGHINDPGTDVLSLVVQAGVPYKFPQAALDEADALPYEVSEEDCNGRLDLRDATTFTIDGEDTKDIDDAISFEELPDGNIRLGVHIADVSHYVKPGTALDEAAFERGTSIYLADRVIPMLPHKLSSGICSLLPNVDRLAISCIMTVTPQGNVIDYEIAKSVINSKRRFTYDEVQEMLELSVGDGLASPANSESCKADEHNWHSLAQAMDALRATLRKNRDTAGALDFNLPESHIRVDETGTPISISPRFRTHATAIIEEFMILTNETIAVHALERELPFVFRTHEPPGHDRVVKLATLVKSLGFSAPQSAEQPSVLQRLLAKTQNSTAAQAIATAVLHALPQARYTATDPTHYGLASDGYCHFTSPIRRYADLQVHRQLFHRQTQTDIPAICVQCSTTERIAEHLEREVEALKKVQFMQSQEGQTFDGTVSGVTAWGVYVMLPNTVEGLIPWENLARHHFKFQKDTATYIRALKKGSRKTVLRHGAEVSVRLSQVNEDEMKIIFAIRP